MGEKAKVPRLGISVAEWGEAVGISRPSAYEAARRGDVEVVRIGKRLIVPMREVRRWLGNGMPSDPSVPG